MKLSEKLRKLRETEGTHRGLERAMTQGELSRALEAEQGQGLSQAYLSQIESGTRPHLSHTSRALLARFFQVHPGYLVDDPEGYHPQPRGEVFLDETRLDAWLTAGAHRFSRDAALAEALHTLAAHHDSRRCLLHLAQGLRQAADPHLSEDVCSSSRTLSLCTAAATGDGQ